MSRALLLSALCVPALFGADSALQSANAKMDKLSNEKAKRGEVIVFSPAEIDAWVRDEVPKAVSQGIREPKVELGQDTALTSALVDLVKIEQARGKTPGMVSKMFAGERPLKVALRIESAGGKCTVFVTRVELGGASLEGTVLNLLISTFFTPLYPDAKIGQPFDIGYNIDRIELRPDGIRVAIKK
jgi:hypothetical protein